MESGANLCDPDWQQSINDEEDRIYLLRKALHLIECEYSSAHQRVFHTYVIEQRDPNLVAAEMGISVGTVYAIKSKILSRLRQEIGLMFD
jgi:DNA-directed RNA polymerase specialized sigma subunit